MPELRVARSELILGGQAGARSRRAEALAQAWLGAAAGHRVVYVATAQAWDPGMFGQAGTRGRGPGPDSLQAVTVEEPTELAHALGTGSRADTLIVVDCLTLWLTASMMQALTPDESDAYMAAGHPVRPASLAQAVAACAGPLVLIGHQPDSLPLRRDLDALIETLGTLDRQAVAACERVTLMAAGQAITVKGDA